MIKLLALDVDGTLIGENNRISEGVKEAIGKVVENKGTIALLSGRNYYGMKEYIEDLGIVKGIAASANGAEMVEIETETLLSKVPIEYQAAKMAVEEAKRLDCVPINFSDLHVYTEGFEHLSETYKNILNQHFYKIESIVHNIQEHPPSKLMMAGHRESLEQLKQEMLLKYEEEVNLDFSMPYLLEAYSKKADKGKALVEIMKFYRISPEETMCVGDSENDRSMFRQAGLAVAMGNAMEHV
ncbi:MAG TPA: hypothetical protein DHN33_00120, partial [Eubacteriaceae bacterium]|nr:hypothetical protein [Eubacteriaceae bacterium]